MNNRLATQFLSLDLPSPFLLGASPLSENMDRILALEDAGAGGLVMHSLFEEQITNDEEAIVEGMEWGTETYAEALSYFPALEDFPVQSEEYLHRLSRIKDRVSFPVIGSLNGRTDGGWVRYAKAIEQAGADALELNVYDLPTDPEVSGEQVERRLFELVRAVRDAISIPLAVKLAPFYSSLPHVVRTLEAEGANGVVLFNRFYQPDFNIDDLSVEPRLYLSTSNELLLRLRWIAILHGRCGISLGLSGGVHHVRDAVKAIMAGADAVQVVSLVLRSGIHAFEDLVQGVTEWMDEHEYADIAQLRGVLSQKNCPDPSEFERANYLKTLHLWKG